MLWSFLISLAMGIYLSLWFLYPDVQAIPKYKVGIPIAIFVMMGSTYLLYGTLLAKLKSMIRRFRQG